MAPKTGETTDEKRAEAVFDAKWLKGLEFTELQEKKEKDDEGKEVIKKVPVRRALTEDDLLDWKTYGREVVLVTADGRKHRVKR